MGRRTGAVCRYRVPAWMEMWGVSQGRLFQVGTSLGLSECAIKPKHKQGNCRVLFPPLFGLLEQHLTSIRILEQAKVALFNWNPQLRDVASSRLEVLTTYQPSHVLMGNQRDSPKTAGRGDRCQQIEIYGTSGKTGGEGLNVQSGSTRKTHGTRHVPA